MILAAIGGTLIGLPTLRLRGDYIAIVTLAFGEIIGRIALNGAEIKIGDYKLTNGQQAISPIDQPDLPFFAQFDSAFSLRGYYWLGLAMLADRADRQLRLRDSRLGRAWIALREDEVAAASHGRAARANEAARLRARRGDRRRRRRVPRRLPERDQLEPVPVLVLDLRAGDGDPRRPRLDLGDGDRARSRSRSSTAA